jgi:cell division protein FtsB
MIKKLIQKLKSISFFDYLLFLLIFSNLIIAYGAFRAGDISKGLDKVTIALLFWNMFLAGRLQDQSKVLMGEYQKLSDLKTEIIDGQSDEIEALRQENAKLKDKQVYPAGFEG